MASEAGPDSPVPNDAPAANLDEDYVQRVGLPPEAPRPVAAMPTAQVLKPVTPIRDRTFEAECTDCGTRLSFKIPSVQPCRESWWSWWAQASDVFRIGCPVCCNRVDVTRVLPAWVKRRFIE
jgi:hypothetical protein